MNEGSKGVLMRPRVTYQAGETAFDRILKEESLADLKKSIRTKLGLTHDTPIHLAQLRHGVIVVLEDEDDFEAFCSAAVSSSPLTVAVTVGEQSGRESSAIPSYSPKPVASLLEKPAIEALPPSPVASSSPFAELVVPSSSAPRKRKSSVAEKPKAEKKAKNRKDVTEGQMTDVNNLSPSALNTVPDSTQKFQSKLDFGGQDTAKKGKKRKKVDKTEVSIESDSGNRNALVDQVVDIGHSPTTPQPPIPDHAGDVKEKKQRRKKAGKVLPDVSFPDISAGESHPKETDEKSEQLETVEAAAPSDSALVSGTTKVKAKKTKATKKKDSAADDPQYSEFNTFPQALAAAISTTDGNSAEMLNTRLTLGVAESREGDEPDIQVPKQEGDSISSPWAGMLSSRIVKKSSKKNKQDVFHEPYVILDTNDESKAVKPKKARKKGSKAQSDTIDAAAKTTKKTKTAQVVQCPVCLEKPLHLRYQCPIISAGPKSVRKRLDELKLEDQSEAHTQLIEELGALLTKMLSKGAVKSRSTNIISQKDEDKSPQHSAQTSASTTPSLGFLIPSRSSTPRAESPNRESNDEQTNQNVFAYTRPAFKASALPSDSELEAIVRGPKASRSILNQINSSSDEDEKVGDIVSEEEGITRHLSRGRNRASTSSADDREIFDQDAENAQPSLLDTTSVLGNRSNAVSLTVTTSKTGKALTPSHLSAPLRSPGAGDLPESQPSSIGKQVETPSTPGPIVNELLSSPPKNDDIAVKSPLSPKHRDRGTNLHAKGAREVIELTTKTKKAQGTQNTSRTQIEKTPAAKSKKFSYITPSAPAQTQRTSTPLLTKISDSPKVYELESSPERGQKTQTTKKNDPSSQFPDSDTDLRPDNLSSSHSGVSMSRYRKLTDIARQHKLFDHDALSTASSQVRTPIQQMSENHTEQDEEDEGDDSSSDSEVELQSHIPRSRRAGTSRKSPGLLLNIYS